MAYNVLKGNVQFINSTTGSIESMVDDYSNQTIAGVKTFSGIVTASSGLSASVFYGDGSALDGLTPVGVQTYNSSGDNRVLTSVNSTTIQGEANLIFDGSLLTVTGAISASSTVSGSEFYGAATGLTSIPTNQFNGNISAADLNLGNGVENSSGNLTLTLSASSGLALSSAGLGVDPNNATSIAGGSLASADEFLVADNDKSNGLRKATITNLQTYMQNSLTFRAPAGSEHQIQFKDGSGAFAASSDLTFNDTTNILTVTGQLTASNLVSSSFYGDGNNLTNLPAVELSGTVRASNINIGDGLFNDGNALAVSASFGLTASASGLEVTASATSGLNVSQTYGLVVSPIRSTTLGTLASGDIFLVSDVDDSNLTKGATLTTLNSYIQSNVAGGSNTQVQFNNSNALAGSSTFTFNSAANILTFETGSITGDLDIQGNTTMSGTLKVNVDRLGDPLITLDKGENDTAEIEFKNNGITVAEIYSNAGESLFIRSVSLGINLRQGTHNVLNIDSSDTTFAHRPVTINHNLTVTGSTTTATRILNVSSSNVDCSIGTGNDILTMTNTSPAKVTLPTVGAGDVGTIYTIKQAQTANVQVSGAIGQTIDGNGEVRTLTSQGEYIRLVATPLGAGYGWIIVGKSGSFF